MTQLNDNVRSEARGVLDRLLHVPLSRQCDRARVEAAIGDHLRALGIDPRPVEWVQAADPDESARAALLAFWSERFKNGKPQMVDYQATATREALVGSGLRTTGVVGPALEEEKEAGRSVRNLARHSVFGLGDFSGLYKAKVKGDRENIDVVREVAGLDRLMDVGRAALAEKGIYQKFGLIANQMDAKREAGLRDLKRGLQFGSAPAQALEAANWLARAEVLRAAGKPAHAHERVANVYMPLVDAVEAGLWLVWVTDDKVIAVAAPEE
jgi:hypothetical protein